ncbi:MAG: alpha-amylase family glycosyl hydrolase [Promethearchaeota archaeon]
MRSQKMLLLFGFVLLLIPGFSSGIVTESLNDETVEGSAPSQFSPFTFARDFIFPSVPPTVAGDNDISWAEVLHDTQDGFYRNPGWGTTTGTNKSGAVPVGTDVILRLRTKADDVVTAQIRYYDGAGSIEAYVSMAIISSADGYDFWEGNFLSPGYPSDYYYRFILTDGSDTDYYQDDYPYGGPGQVVNDVTDGNLDFGLIFYDPAFTTPEWHKNAIGYQIFTDSFFNGDMTNDAIGDGSSGDITWWEWDSTGDNSFTVSDSQRTYALDNPWGSTPVAGHGYYGGDLSGVAQKADYLASLGVKLIWFCPISESPDNHGYSVDNYNSVDPYYGKIASRENGEVINNQTGSMEVFDDMVATLDDVGIRAIYDAVLNHASAQSKYFQRFEFASGFDVPNPYETEVLGAYQDKSSPYFDWFSFNSYNHNYDAWWGFLNIPTLMYEQAGGDIEDDLITGEDSLFSFWNEHNISGFRLDVPNMYQDGDGSRYINKLIRDQVKTNDPSDIIIGEIWGRANAWLTGDMHDGVQNMPFGDDTIAWLKGNTPDDLYSSHLLFPQENYPPEAFYSLWTILGNHDTARVLTRLEGDTDAVLLAATLQYTYPGIPMVYYGDEVGLAGASDPANRGAYPWGAENTTMQEYYIKLGQIRNTYPVLRTGGFEILPDIAEGILIFGRELPDVQYPESVILVNRLEDAVQFTVNISILSMLNSGDILRDILGTNENYTISDAHTITVVMQPQSALILMHEDPEWDATDPTDTGSTITGYSWGLMLLGMLSITSIIGHNINKNRILMK